MRKPPRLSSRNARRSSKAPDALETTQRGKSDGSVNALSAHDLTLPRGLVYGMPGPDGGGNGTLLRLAGGITPSRDSSGRRTCRADQCAMPEDSSLRFDRAQSPPPPPSQYRRLGRASDRWDITHAHANAVTCGGFPCSLLHRACACLAVWRCRDRLSGRSGPLLGLPRNRADGREPQCCCASIATRLAELPGRLARRRPACIAAGFIPADAGFPFWRGP